MCMIKKYVRWGCKRVGNILASNYIRRAANTVHIRDGSLQENNNHKDVSGSSSAGLEKDLGLRVYPSAMAE
jgi:hypothetical protein